MRGDHLNPVFYMIANVTLGGLSDALVCLQAEKALSRIMF